MSKEKLFREQPRQHSFLAKLASKTAYEMASYAPFLMGGVSMMRTFEDRPVLEKILTWTLTYIGFDICNKIKKRVIAEAEARQFKVKEWPFESQPGDDYHGGAGLF